MLKGLRPVTASVAIAFMVGSGIGTIVLGVYFLIVLFAPSWGSLFFGAGVLGVLLTWLLGFIYAYGGWALWKDQSWGWGAGVFGGALYLMLGWLISPILFAAFMGIAIVVMVLLFQAREYYGMVRPDPEAEERARQELRAQRMANPDRFHCPRCGATSLWVAPDGSAYCESCRAGIISIPLSA